MIYLFDFDGTLVDSMPTYVSVMLSILDGEGIEYGDDIVKIITPLGFAGTAEYFSGLGVKLSVEEMMARMREGAVREYTYSIKPKANVVETLTRLKARGDRLNVLTASPHDTLDPCLKRIGIYGLFDNVWSCDDFGTTKADVSIYTQAARRIGAPVEDIIFLDDNYNADLTAARAGMRVWGVYDDSSKEYCEDMKNICERYIYDFAEILETE